MRTMRSNVSREKRTVITNEMTPCSRVLELTVLRLGKKFLAFYGTQRFITALTQ